MAKLVTLPSCLRPPNFGASFCFFSLFSLKGINISLTKRSDFTGTVYLFTCASILQLIKGSPKIPSKQLDMKGWMGTEKHKLTGWPHYANCFSILSIIEHPILVWIREKGERVYHHMN